MTRGGLLQVHPHCLIFFVDETGHEAFADPLYPVFGMGGCAVMAGAIDVVVRQPWRDLKAKHFGGPDVPLHASSLRDITADQAAAVGRFFREQKFGRFAVTMNSTVRLPDGVTPITVMPGALRARWQELAARCSPLPIEIAFVHEASERGDGLLEKHFGPSVVHIDGNVIPTRHAIIPKASGDECMEVADFVVHTAGAQARKPSALAGGSRRDFQAVFHHPLWASFIHIDSVGDGE